MVPLVFAFLRWILSVPVGHRASAESLAKQFQLLFPGSTYELIDVWTLDGCYPYRTLVDSYKHLSAHPRRWRFLYHLSNTRPWEIMVDVHSTFMCERKMRKRIASYKPDVIVSVHPAMQLLPMTCVKRISRKLGKHIPFFTVVTDLGSGHCTWFQKNPEKIYIASERIRRLTKRRGGTPDERIVMSGLPIRHEFDVHAKAMKDRTTPKGKEYVKQLKEQVGISADRPMVLIMGGGEGVGSLSQIVDDMYRRLVTQGVDATICVVCGRNEHLQKNLQERDWASMDLARRRRTLGESLKHRKSRMPEYLARLKDAERFNRKGNVKVIGLGFVTNMADYMTAADVLVTKAGPGSIAEAAAVGLPVMLTSFLPGQEAGNVGFVLDSGFGDYNEDPLEIADEVTFWLQNKSLMDKLSRNAREAGHPSAAENIVRDIGSISKAWMSLNSK